MKLLLLPVVVLLVVLPPVFAFQCTILSSQQQELCKQITQLNMTESEKDMLMTLAFYSERTMPNHDFVAFWNQQITMVTPPTGIQTQNSGVIRNAWVKIVSVMPSVIENGTLYCSRTGILQSAYSYDVILPQGTQGGDCKTSYSLYRNRTSFNTFQNGYSFGSGKLSSFTLDESSQLITFTSQLSIIIDTKIDHYRNEKYCCSYSGGRCKRYCSHCVYKSTDIRTDSLFLIDSLNSSLYKNKPLGDVSLQQLSEPSTFGTLSITNSSRVELEFQNSSYIETGYLYDFNYSLQPYNVLTLTAQLFKQERQNNIFITKKNTTSSLFIVQNPLNCSLQIGDHFSLRKMFCNSDFNSLNISLQTDKFYYKENETIIVSIHPENIPISITYGNDTKLAINTTYFPAQYPNTKLSGSYENKHDEVYISVRNQDHLLTASKLVLFCFLNYIIFSYITNSRPFSKWLIVD